MTDEIQNESWEEANNGDSKIIRWDKEDKPEVIDKTIFVGDVIQGVWVDTRTEVGKKKGTLYVVRTKEHGDLAIWGSTVLKNAFAKIPMGSEVRVQSLGIQSSKKGDTEYRNFKVQFRQAPMVDVTQEDEPEM